MTFLVKECLPPTPLIMFNFPTFNCLINFKQTDKISIRVTYYYSNNHFFCRRRRFDYKA